jgi:hypothetical protein
LTHKRADNLDDAVDILTNRLKRNGTGEISLNNFDVSGALVQTGPEAFLPRTNTRFSVRAADKLTLRGFLSAWHGVAKS